MVGCGKKYYWEYSCIWHCDEPYCIDIPAYGTRGSAIINDEEINLYIENDDRDTEVEIYDSSNVNHRNLLWVCSMEVKKDTLYLTILEDYVSDNEGVTIQMEQTYLE